MKEIPLTQGKVALVDDSDYEYLSQFKWYFSSGYAVRKVRNFVTGKQTCEFMHRRLMGPIPRGLEVDHKDGCRYNNTRSNLRIVTHQQNAANVGKAENKSSRFKGVSWNKRAGKWKARLYLWTGIQRPRQWYIHLGYFDSELEAARAYNRDAAEWFGPYARLNQLPEDAT